jgi:hypothetical protein
VKDLGLTGVEQAAYGVQGGIITEDVAHLQDFSE